MVTKVTCTISLRPHSIKEKFLYSFQRRISNLKNIFDGVIDGVIMYSVVAYLENTDDINIFKKPCGIQKFL